MSKPSLTEKIARDITRVVLEHPHDLTRFIAAKERITRAAAARYVYISTQGLRGGFDLDA